MYGVLLFFFLVYKLGVNIKEKAVRYTLLLQSYCFVCTES